MKSTRLIMGMPITVEVLGNGEVAESVEKVFTYFTSIDEKFSTYKSGSEISQINRGEKTLEQASPPMREVFKLAADTKRKTKGYFDIISPSGLFDPSGIVKGWAIWQAARILETEGFENFFIEAGGDIQAKGVNSEGQAWRVGIRNPFNSKEIVKVLLIGNQGVATSGSYERGAHIYNPHNKSDELKDIVSITVIGPNIYEADRFATAAFAMGREGIDFIEQLPGLEGYQIDRHGIGVETSGFEKFVIK